MAARRQGLRRGLVLNIIPECGVLKEPSKLRRQRWPPAPIRPQLSPITRVWHGWCSWGDAAGPVGIATSRRKAYSAAATGMTTSKLAQFLTDNHANPTLVDPELLPLPGGVPIISHGLTIGAIGVGGGHRDEACAQAGLDSIKNELE